MIFYSLLRKPTHHEQTNTEQRLTHQFTETITKLISLDRIYPPKIISF